MTICVHHNKDLDGYTSGAVVRKKFPDCKLIGWDYGMPIPEIESGNDVILIDISFPLQEMLKLRQRSKSLTWIDHHISQKVEWDKYMFDNELSFEDHGIEYIYENGIAACEIGWKYYFPSEEMPGSVLLLGQYDTWRGNGTPKWDDMILPFQFYMRTVCTSPETFPTEFFDEDYIVYEAIEKGKLILKYQEQQDMLKCQRGAFEREAYGGLRALCLNEGVFSSETLKSIEGYEDYDVLIGFIYNKSFWRISLRTIKDNVDVSAIAKARGGGGHRKAAGFEVKTFDEIFI